MEKLEKKIEKLASEQVIKGNPKEKLEEYLAASKVFDDLVKQGFAKRRGFNLLSIDKKNNFQSNDISLNDYLLKL
ncbi:hypothetical protein [uncultured Chryseobacterium sp.]|uniref:hypothetical protein n=1 Tax=uncultured Chryseobacterium sp. TaxID=259322 RepID=UPI00374A4E6E